MDRETHPDGTWENPHRGMSGENSDWVQPGLQVEVHCRPVYGLEGYGRGLKSNSS